MLGLVAQAGEAARVLGQVAGGGHGPRQLADDITVHASASGLPGWAFVGQAMGWLAQIVLAGGAAAIFLGAIMSSVGRRVGNAIRAEHGKELVLGGLGAAILGGLGPTIINLLYHAAGG